MKKNNYPDKVNKKNHGLKDTQISLCSVCIATYNRIDLLEQLLNSLENQELPADIEIEIVVVDNDITKSAEDLINKHKKSSRYNIYYYNQPQKNISITRNMAIEKASGGYILFIDDDETASKKWVYHLKKTVDKFNADGAFGPVIAKFNEDTPEWMRCNDLFYNPVGETGTKAHFTWTSNCIIHAPLLKKMREPFDSRYGISGGGDPHLFERLMQKGAHLVNCREATVHEFLPQSRTNISYLFLRNMKGGTSFARRIIEFSGKKHLKTRIVIIIKGLIYAVTSFVLMAIFCMNHLRRTKWMIKFAGNIGKICAVFGFYYKIYK